MNYQAIRYEHDGPVLADAFDLADIPEGYPWWTETD